MIRLTDRMLFHDGGLPLQVRARFDVVDTDRIVADSVKVMFVTDGWTRITHETGQSELGPGSVFTVPERVWCQGSPQGFVRTVTIYLHAEFIASHLRWLPRAHPVVAHIARSPSSDRVPGALRLGDRAAQVLRPRLALLAALDGVPHSEFASLARVASVFDDVAFLAAAGRPSGLAEAVQRRVIPHAQVAQAVRILHEQLGRAWTVSELARSVMLSESQLTRLFQRDLGCSPATFLWNARTDRMAELLATSDITASEAARKAGWASFSAAGRAFKRRYGLPPHRYSVRLRAADFAP